LLVFVTGSLVGETLAWNATRLGKACNGRGDHTSSAAKGINGGKMRYCFAFPSFLSFPP
jgi:hypothetical protein